MEMMYFGNMNQVLLGYAHSAMEVA